MLLKFSSNKTAAKQYVKDHIQWIDRGLNDGIILAAGSLLPGLGGAILANNISAAELHDRLNEDPFVSENVVSAEILEFAASKTDERLKFLLP